MKRKLILLAVLAAVVTMMVAFGSASAMADKLSDGGGKGKAQEKDGKGKGGDQDRDRGQHPPDQIFESDFSEDIVVDPFGVEEDPLSLGPSIEEILDYCVANYPACVENTGPVLRSQPLPDHLAGVFPPETREIFQETIAPFVFLTALPELVVASEVIDHIEDYLNAVND